MAVKRPGSSPTYGKIKGSMVTQYRRGIYAVVLLAFPALLFITLSRRPSFAAQEPSKPDIPLQMAASNPQLSLAGSENAAEMPHNPLSKGKSSSSFQQAAAAVADLVDSEPHSVYDFKAEDIEGEIVDLSTYKGDVAIVVNVASHCGYTDVNYRELQQLFKKYSSQGFTVLAFPCNQFGAQEPGTPAEILQFATEKYHVEFPLFKKLEVNGDDAHPLFVYLKKQFGMKAIPWNFQKFLIDRQGQPVHQYPSQIDPMAFEMEIVKLLNKQS